MKKFRLALIAVPAIVIGSCTGINNAEIIERETLMKFYGEPGVNIGVAMEITSDGGYICLGNNSSTGNFDDEGNAVIYKLDANGNILHQNTIPNFVGNSIIETENGYLVAGDCIYEPTANVQDNLTAMCLIRLSSDLSFNESSDVTDNIPEFRRDEEPGFDYHGISLVQTTTTEAVVLGTFETDLAIDDIILSEIDLGTMTPNWTRTYGTTGFSAEPANSLHLNDLNDLVWSSTFSTEDEDNNILSYMSVITAEEDRQSLKSVDDLGAEELGTVSYRASDICPIAGGFAVVGSVDDLQDNSDIFFVRTNISGILQDETQITFGADNNDFGIAVTTAVDGGFLILGARTTIEGTTDIGKGGTDFLLVKTDVNLVMEWEQVIGGSFDEGLFDDEVHGAIRQSADGSIAIWSSSEFSGVRNFVFIKTNRDGQLID